MKKIFELLMGLWIIYFFIKQYKKDKYKKNNVNNGAF